MVNIDREKCIGCGLCAGDCLGKAISLDSGKAEMIKGCFMCGHCVAICPTEAISFVGEKYDMADVESVGEGFGIDSRTMLHAIKTRRSIRRFKKQGVDRATLETLLEAGRFSPTASNAQNVRYIVFSEDTEALRRTAMEELRSYEHDEEAFSKVFPPPMSRDRMDFKDDDFLFKGAPVVILTVSPSIVNGTIAAANMELQGVAQGLGMLYVGFFVRMAAQSRKVRDFIGLAEDEQVVNCLCFGWPDVEYRRTVPRRKLNAEWR